MVSGFQRTLTGNCVELPISYILLGKSRLTQPSKLPILASILGFAYHIVRVMTAVCSFLKVYFFFLTQRVNVGDSYLAILESFDLMLSGIQAALRRVNAISRQKY